MKRTDAGDLGKGWADSGGIGRAPDYSRLEQKDEAVIKEEQKLNSKRNAHIQSYSCVYLYVYMFELPCLLMYFALLRPHHFQVERDPRWHHQAQPRFRLVIQP